MRQLVAWDPVSCSCVNTVHPARVATPLTRRSWLEQCCSTTSVGTTANLIARAASKRLQLLPDRLLSSASAGPRSRLLHHATGRARPAAAERRGCVAVVVAARMDHERAPRKVGELQARRRHRDRRLAVGIGVQNGEITEVPLGVWPEVFARGPRVVVPARGEAGNQLAVLLGRGATRGSGVHGNRGLPARGR